MKVEQHDNIDASMLNHNMTKSKTKPCFTQQVLIIALDVKYSKLKFPFRKIAITGVIRYTSSFTI